MRRDKQPKQPKRQDCPQPAMHERTRGPLLGAPAPEDPVMCHQTPLWDWKADSPDAGKIVSCQVSAVNPPWGLSWLLPHQGHTTFPKDSSYSVMGQSRKERLGSLGLLG